LAEKARSLYKAADGATLAVLIFEVMLLAAVGNATEAKDDALTAAATLYKVDAKALRRTVVQEEKERQQKRKATKRKKGTATPRTQAAPK
jgi:hypothetical protein